MDNLINILIILVCYFIGAIPTSYILLKKKLNKDITQEGSKNSGATNLYELTKSRKLYLLAMALDVLKGAIPILIFIKLFDFHGFFLFIFGLSLIFGHNYSIFIKMKGGKGLATAAGVTLILFPLAVPVWLLLYYISKKAIFNDVHIASIIALFGIPVFISSTPSQIIHYFLNIFHNVNVEYWEFILFSVLMAFIIASKHFNNIKVKIQSKMKEIKENQNA